ncbi:hypothetical protein F7725_004544 [Dissostichus mawsoni]|uniref:Uncharacterized protein n=1 Tax=Dissostichus mawsoni TaxID=36200 RepID=A0A7J5XJC6_DISMA|nr:hypothetical protein F7725_004544 [Dissostichus mawsoni]
MPEARCPLSGPSVPRHPPVLILQEETPPGLTWKRPREETVELHRDSARRVQLSMKQSEIRQHWCGLRLQGKPVWGLLTTQSHTQCLRTPLLVKMF